MATRLVILNMLRNDHEQCPTDAVWCSYLLVKITGQLRAPGVIQRSAQICSRSRHFRNEFRANDNGESHFTQKTRILKLPKVKWV
jgi:hypothetical protein